MRSLGPDLGRIGAVILALSLIAIVLWLVATTWRPSPVTYVLQGLDVSEAQGVVDWPMVRSSDATFAYVRATDGTARDAQFDANWHGVDAAGLRRGAVHAYSLCKPGIDQANAFVSTVPRTADALPAAVEVAYTPDCTARPDRAALVQELSRFAAIVETHTGKPVLFKVARSVERAYQLTAALPRPIWSVANFFAPDYAARPWRMWQASDMKRIDGVSGPVHWDVVAP
jgi:lysozyme